MARQAKPPEMPAEMPSGLSPQQQEIYRLARQGKTITEIAAQLKSAPNTVKQQLHRIRNSVNKSVYKNPGGDPCALNPASALDPDDPDFLQLSGRQQEILGYHRNGKRNKNISGILGIAPETVRVHIHRARAKLGKPGQVRRSFLTDEEAETYLKLQAECEARRIADKKDLLPTLRSYYERIDRPDAEKEIALRAAGLISFTPGINQNNAASLRLHFAGRRSQCLVLTDDEAKQAALELKHYAARLLFQDRHAQPDELARMYAVDRLSAQNLFHSVKDALENT